MAVDLDPSMYWAEFKLGLWYMDVGNYTAAEPYFQKVVKYTDNIPRANYYLGLCYWYTGKHEYALKLLEDVVRKDTSNHDAVFHLNKIKTRLHIVSDSLVHLKRDTVH